MLRMLQAHGLDAGPTQRPLLAGAIAGVSAVIPALSVLAGFQSPGCACPSYRHVRGGYRSRLCRPDASRRDLVRLAVPAGGQRPAGRLALRDGVRFRPLDAWARPTPAMAAGPAHPARLSRRWAAAGSTALGFGNGGGVPSHPPSSPRQPGERIRLRIPVYRSGGGGPDADASAAPTFRAPALRRPALPVFRPGNLCPDVPSNRQQQELGHADGNGRGNTVGRA